MSDGSIGIQMIVSTGDTSAESAPRAASEGASKSGVIEAAAAVKAPVPEGTGKHIDKTA